MAIDPNLSKIIAEAIQPHLNEINKTNLNFRDIASQHNDNVKDIINQIYSAINYNNSNVNDLITSIQNNAGQAQQMSQEMRNVFNAVNMNNNAMMQVLNEMKDFNNLSRQTLAKQNNFYNSLSQSLSNFGKKTLVTFGNIGKKLSGGTMIGRGAIQTGGAVAVLGGAAAGAAATGYVMSEMSRMKAQAEESSAGINPESPIAQGGSQQSEREIETERRQGSDATRSRKDEPSTGEGVARKPVSEGKQASRTTGIESGLAELRKQKFGKEITDDNVLRQLAALEKVEVRGMSQSSKLDWIETLVNRASVTNSSLMSRLTGRNRAYWGSGIGNPNKITDKELEAFRKRIQTVIESGRDNTEGATDNASNQEKNMVADRRARKLAAEGRSHQGRWTGGERNKGEYVYVDTPYAKRSEKFRQQAKELSKNIDKDQKPESSGTPSSAAPQQKPDASSAPPKDMDTMSDATKNLRIKDDRGRTTTLGEMGVSSFSQLSTGKYGGQAFRGGRFGRYNDPNVTYMAGEIQGILGDKFNRVTAQNDAFHHGKYANRYRSQHLQGTKLDFTIKGNAKEYRKQIDILTKQLREKYGLVEGEHYKINRNFMHGTGMHVDIGFTPGGRKLIEQYRQNEIKERQEKPEVKPESSKPSGSMLPSELFDKTNIDKMTQSTTSDGKLKKTETESSEQSVAMKPAEPTEGSRLYDESLKREMEQRSKPVEQPPQTQPEQQTRTSEQPVSPVSNWTPRSGSSDYADLATYYLQKNIHTSDRESVRSMRA